MNATWRDKAWARRFARTSGDLGITRPQRRYRMPIAIWHPAKVTPEHRVTVPQPLPQSARRAGSFPGTHHDVASASVQTADTFNAGLSRDSANPSLAATARQTGSSLPSGISCDREHEHSAGRQSIPYVPPPEDISGWSDYIRRALAGEIIPF